MHRACGTDRCGVASCPSFPTLVKVLRNTSGPPKQASQHKVGGDLLLVSTLSSRPPLATFRQPTRRAAPHSLLRHAHANATPCRHSNQVHEAQCCTRLSCHKGLGTNWFLPSLHQCAPGQGAPGVHSQDNSKRHLPLAYLPCAARNPLPGHVHHARGLGMRR
jgi:hypothetical protein